MSCIERGIGWDGFVDHNPCQTDIAGVRVPQRIGDRAAGCCARAAIALRDAQARCGNHWRGVAAGCAGCAVGQGGAIGDLRRTSRESSSDCHCECRAAACTASECANCQATGRTCRAAIGATPAHAAASAPECRVCRNDFVQHQIRQANIASIAVIERVDDSAAGRADITVIALAQAQAWHGRDWRGCAGGRAGCAVGHACAIGDLRRSNRNRIEHGDSEDGIAMCAADQITYG